MGRAVDHLQSAPELVVGAGNQVRNTLDARHSHDAEEREVLCPRIRLGWKW